MAKSVRLEMRGLAKLRDKLDPVYLLDKPIRTGFQRIGTAYLGEAKLRAPVLHGLMRVTLAKGANNSIFEEDPRKPPRFIRVGTSHVSRSGKPYPIYLDAGRAYPKGSKAYDYHYRSGGALGLSGRPTKDWFSGVKKLASFNRTKRQELGRITQLILSRWKK